MADNRQEGAIAEPDMDWEGESEAGDGYDEEGEGEQELALDLDAPNLVSQLKLTTKGRELAEQYVYKAKLEYEQAKDSMENYLKGVDADMRIFYGDLPPKQPPFDQLANLNVPVALENLTRLVFRAEGELFGNWKDIFGVVPIGPDDREAADLLGKHGNWQLLHQIPDFQRQQRRGLLMYFTIGDVTFESYWDATRKCNRHEALTPDEFYTPYTNVSVMPDWSDVPFRGRIYDYHKHELQAFRGLWDDDALDKVMKEESSWEPNPDDMPTDIRDGIADIFGEERPSNGPAPYRILRHETYCKLPGQVRERQVRLTIDLSRCVLLHMSIHEIPDWEDVARYERETQEYQAWTQQNALYEANVRMQEAAVAAGPQDYLRPEPLMPTPPAMPEWMKGDPEATPRKPEMVPLHQFTHGVMIEPLRGSRGFGWGRTQGDSNRFINSALNHHLDAATLSNVPAILADADAQLPGKLPVGGGEVIPVRTDGARSVRDMIHPVHVARETGSLLELVKWGQETAQKSIHSSEVMSGEPGKSGESGRGLLARRDEAVKALAVPTAAYASQVLDPCLVQNARLNSIHMDPYELFLLNDDKEGPMMARIARSLYRRVPYVVEIKSTLRFSTESEKMNNAQQAVGMSVSDPYVMGNAPFAYEAHRKLLESMGYSDMVPLLGEAPQGPPRPFLFVPPGAPPPGSYMPPPPPGPPPGAPPGAGGPPGPQGPPPGPPGPPGEPRAMTPMDNQQAQAGAQ